MELHNLTDFKTYIDPIHDMTPDQVHQILTIAVENFKHSFAHSEYLSEITVPFEGEIWMLQFEHKMEDIIDGRDQIVVRLYRVEKLFLVMDELSLLDPLIKLIPIDFDYNDIDNDIDNEEEI